MMKPLKKLSSDEGFTFIEVFITVIIIAILSSIILINSTTILNSINQGKRDLSYKYQLINLRLLLKKEASNILTPWFLREYKVEEINSGIKIYYYNGDKESYLELTALEEGVVIKNDDNILFSSTNLKGEFIFKESFIVYKDGDREFIFPLGVFIA